MAWGGSWAGTTWFGGWLGEGEGGSGGPAYLDTGLVVVGVGAATLQAHQLLRAALNVAGIGSAVLGARDRVGLAVMLQTPIVRTIALHTPLRS